MADDDAEIAGADGASSFDELAFTGSENLSANQTSVTDPSAERKCEDEIENAGAAKGDEGNGQQDSRKRQKRIHQDDVDEAVDGCHRNIRQSNR